MLLVTSLRIWKMTSPSKNDITGDKLQTKPSTKEYRDGWDAIFGKWERQEKVCESKIDCNTSNIPCSCSKQKEKK